MFPYAGEKPGRRSLETLLEMKSISFTFTVFRTKNSLAQAKAKISGNCSRNRATPTLPSRAT
jgi:hypothetical protein